MSTSAYVRARCGADANAPAWAAFAVCDAYTVTRVYERTVETVLSWHRTREEAETECSRLRADAIARALAFEAECKRAQLEREKRLADKDAAELAAIAAAGGVSIAEADKLRRFGVTAEDGRLYDYGSPMSAADVAKVLAY